jgi:structure-specific recognition protein 1
LRSGNRKHLWLTYVHSEEQQPLEEFFKAKNIRLKNEMVDEVSFLVYIWLQGKTNTQQSSALIAAALDNDDLSSEDDARPDRGSADEDEESVDEDFRADSDSDVAEEYDSAHESSGSESGSDAEMADADGDDAAEDDDGEEEDRPKKKSKVGK